MANPITVVIMVYFSKDDKGNVIVESFPNDDIVIPPRALSKVIWQAVASPSGAYVAPKFTAAWAEGQNQGYIDVEGPFPANQFYATFDSTNVKDFVGAVKFTTVLGGGTNPPSIDGGGTIRNKGTNIWVIFTRANIILSLASLAIGATIGLIYQRFFGAP